ncbi:flagellar hook-associated protein 2 [bacterium BMS3Abin03]|nr:flagellar hook-associated protein 2 [bacterium BMS3Abin03]
MAIDILSTSFINSLVGSYTYNETQKVVSPLQNKKSKYQNLSSAYSTFSTKLSSLKTVLTNLKLTGTDSLFNKNSTTTSNSSFVTATATSSSSNGAYTFRINQLAKSDVAISTDVTSATTNSITGTHDFLIKTGDGSTGEFVSNIEVTFTASETNQTVMEKIADAINSDKAVIESGTKTASSSYSDGASSFVIDLNGTETTISVTGGGTYEDLINEIVSNINDNIDGITAEKVLDSPNTGDVSLKLTVNDSSDYISITHSSGFDLVTDLNISATKEKGASGIVTASAFSPTSTTSQLSITSKETGVDYRIKDISDSGSSTALASVGLNLGTTRTVFDQSPDPDTAGFLYSDITDTNNQLNSKFDFNGLTLQRNSNSVSNLVTGVTFKLQSVMQTSDTTVNMTVVNDVSSIKSSIEDFISKFNDLYTFLRENTKSTLDGRGLLISDTNASSILSSLSSISYTQVSGLSAGNLNLLSQIGISFSSSTGLSISDTSQLETKISEDASQVEALFNSTNGIANTLYDKIDPYLGSGGYLALAQSSFENNISTYDDRIVSAQKRINKSADNLRTSYEGLQIQLANLLATQNMLSFIGNSFF